MERSRNSLNVLDEVRLRQERLQQFVEHKGPYTTFDDWHVIGTTGEPAFQNAWINFNANAPEFAAFWKDSAGIVRLRGIIKSGTIALTAFTLPKGYWPLGTRRFAVGSAGAYGQIDVTITGTVIPTIGSNTWVSLDGVQFRAEV